MTVPNDRQASQAANNASPDDAWNTHIAPKIVRFKDLARCGDEIWIEHEGQLYRLQQTRQGKLILTK